MKANALLELPRTASIIPAGSLVPAVLISDTPSFSLGRIENSMNFLSSSLDSSSQIVNVEKNIDNESHSSRIKVGILTVSDTVSLGNGPDRRYLIFIVFHHYYCNNFLI